MPDVAPIGADTLVIDMVRRFASERLAPGAAAREKAPSGVAWVKERPEGVQFDRTMVLVAEHLLLSDTATRRDLDDERLIVGVADRVGDPGRLAALYLLTTADAEATGPLAWTPWRATLVRELVAKVRHVLERDDVGSGTAERLTARAEEIRTALAGEDSGAVERFLLRMPRGYVLTVPIDRVPIHHRLVAPAVGSHEVRTHATE